MWEKIRELELLKETNMSKKRVVKPEESLEDDDDETSTDIDEDELNDFRCKAGVR